MLKVHCFLYVFRTLSPCKMDSRDRLCQREKRTLPRPDDPLISLCQRHYCLSSPGVGFGMLVRIPCPPLPQNLREAGTSRKWSGPLQGAFARGLGPTHPCPSAVHMETDSASVFCQTRQTNCYYNQDLHWVYAPCELTLRTS